MADEARLLSAGSVAESPREAIPEWGREGRASTRGPDVVVVGCGDRPFRGLRVGAGSGGAGVLVASVGPGGVPHDPPGDAGLPRCVGHSAIDDGFGGLGGRGVRIGLPALGWVAFDEGGGAECIGVGAESADPTWAVGLTFQWFLPGQPRWSVCTCPFLHLFIFEQLGPECFVACERRSAREESQLARPKNGPCGGAGADAG